MMPEETVQAGIDIGAITIMPIHWGVFRLANHSWTAPIERVVKAAEKKGLPIATPKIGASISVDSTTKVYSDWWTRF